MVTRAPSRRFAAQNQCEPPSRRGREPVLNTAAIAPRVCRRAHPRLHWSATPGRRSRSSAAECSSPPRTLPASPRLDSAQLMVRVAALSIRGPPEVPQDGSTGVGRSSRTWRLRECTPSARAVEAVSYTGCTAPGPQSRPSRRPCPRRRRGCRTRPSYPCAPRHRQERSASQRPGGGTS